MDYTGQEWYNAELSASENYNSFLEAQKDLGYVLGDFFGTPELDMQCYTELKIKASQEEVKKAEFYKARDLAFQALAQEHDAERIALGQLWQTKEDNDYTI